MNYSGANTKFQIGLESGFGTAITPDVQLEFLSESLHQVNTSVESEALVGAVTTPFYSVVGKKVEGDVSIEVHPDKIADILYAALGVEADPTEVNTGVYSHAFTAVSGGNSLPSLTAVVDKKADIFTYSGLKVDSFSLETDPGSLLTSTVSMIGQKELLTGELQTLSVSTINPWDFNHMKIYFGEAGSVATTNIDVATSFSMNYANNLENDLYVADGTQYMSEFDYQKRDITFDIETLYTIATNAYRENNYKDGDKLSVRVEFTHDALVAAGYPYKLTIDMLNAVITEAPNDISGPERLRIPLSFRALQSGSDEPITITLVDGVSTSRLGSTG